MSTLLNTTAIRSDFFPLKSGKFHYLDSAATSLTPEEVVSVMDAYYRTYRATVHRGLYKEAEFATEAYETSRKLVAEFVGASPEEIIFTSGATEAANMLVYALEHTLDLNEGDEIVTTVMEHHAMLLPLQELAKRNKLVMKYAQLTNGFALDTVDLQGLVTNKTRIVAVTAASNVTGNIVDVIIDVDNDVERPIIIRDATVAVGHMPVSVGTLDVDFVFFSGHKMCGPTGVGVLYGKKEQLARLEPGFFGGGMIRDLSPEGTAWMEGVERFEAGTPNIAGAIGLGAAVDYLQDIDIEEIHTHVRGLTVYAQERLTEVPGVTLYAAPPEHNVGIVSFTLDGVHPHDVAQVCADNRVAIRAGHHCALPLHKELGLTATARASFYLYNTKEDVDAFMEAITKARTIFASH